MKKKLKILLRFMRLQKYKQRVRRAKCRFVLGFDTCKSFQINPLTGMLVRDSGRVRLLS